MNTRNYIFQRHFCRCLYYNFDYKNERSHSEVWLTQYNWIEFRKIILGYIDVGDNV